MPGPVAFESWYALVRAGDAEAAAALVRRVEPVLRRVIRARLTRVRLARVVDPADVSQAVLGTFFARVVTSDRPVESERALVALLVVIARNKVRNEVRRHWAGRRVIRTCPNSHLVNFPSGDPTPSRVAALNDLYARVMGRFTPFERQLVEERAWRADWASIAAATGYPAGLLREKFHRALQRVRHELRWYGGF